MVPRAASSGSLRYRIHVLQFLQHCAQAWCAPGRPNIRAPEPRVVNSFRTALGRPGGTWGMFVGTPHSRQYWSSELYSAPSSDLRRLELGHSAGEVVDHLALIFHAPSENGNHVEHLDSIVVLGGNICWHVLRDKAEVLLIAALVLESYGFETIQELHADMWTVAGQRPVAACGPPRARAPCSQRRHRVRRCRS